MISFVTPVFEAEKTITPLIHRIEKVMFELNLPFEIILVDDRSTDNSWSILTELAGTNINVKAVRLSKNFGQHPAIIAGLSLVKGEWTVVLDCDLQDRPEEVVNLYKKAMEGYDAVIARRENRNDSFFKKMSSLMFARVFGYLTDTKYDHKIANFGIYHRKIIDATLRIADNTKFFPLFVKHTGFNTTSIEVLHSPRENGRSNYNLSKLLKLAFNVIISYSNKPLRIFVKLGILISFISFLFGVYYLFLAISGKIIVLGYSSLMISIWFLSGVLITIIGVCGIYIGKIFDQTKQRPVYIIDEIK